MPGAVVREIGAYFLIRKGQLVRAWHITPLDDKHAMTPTVKVPLVHAQIGRTQVQLVLPHGRCCGVVQFLQAPLSVMPGAVALFIQI